MTNLRIDPARLWDSLMAMGEIGATPGGGSRRLALTEEDRIARDRFIAWVRAAGCTVSIDRMGNIFARRAGTRDDLPPVCVGSHLDTVPTGGKFDGVYGVLAGLELFRTLDDAGVRTKAPLELIVWTNEEGSRFSPATLGSAVFAGALSLEAAYAKTDPQGVSLGAALETIGYGGAAPAGGRHLGAYFEAHVEQGPELEQAGDVIGIVTGSYIARYFVVTVTGVAAHVGPTPMAARRDALVAAAHLVLEINRIGRAYGPDGRANAPHIELYPNVRGVIPAEVKLSCDVRHADPETVKAMEAELAAVVRRLSAELDVGTDMVCYAQFGPTRFDDELTGLLRTSAAALGYRRRDILAIAGHDAITLSPVVPSAMIFVPSRGGLSHNEAEYTDADQCAAGANVLLQAVLAKAEIAA